MTAKQAFRLAYALVRADRSADMWGLGETSSQRRAANAFYAELNRAADYRSRDLATIDLLGRSLDVALLIEASR